MATEFEATSAKLRPKAVAFIGTTQRPDPTVRVTNQSEDSSSSADCLEAR